MTPGKFIVSVLMVTGFCPWLFSSCIITVPNGCGDLDLAIVASRLTTVINGSDSIVLTGKTADYRATINGSGDIRAFNLESKRAAVSIAGSGDCCLCASESLTAFISGSGDVTYTGSPPGRG